MPASSSTSDADNFVLVILGCLALSAGIGSAGWLWIQGTRWLVAHQVLVAAENHPLLPLPHADGAGLDLQRVAVAAGAVLLAVAVLISAARRAWLRRRQQAAAS